MSKVANVSGVPAAVITLLGTIVAAIFTCIGALAAALLSFYGARLQLGSYRKQMQAIELATKRTAYWIEYLKLSKLANDAEINS